MARRTARPLGRVSVGAAVVAILLPFLASTATGEVTPRNPVWAQEPTGFAAVAGNGLDGTTGGKGGEIVTVSTQEDLEQYAGLDEPYIIQVRGPITIEPFGREITVGSNTSIIGLGSTAEIIQGGFFLKEVHNVIIRNLTIRDSYLPGDWDGQENDYDGIQVDTSHHIWIDHNQFLRTGDGQADIRIDSDYVTLSWNIFADHNKALGLGWTDNVVTKVTMHHNWFRNIYQRSPSFDNTAVAHMYNNYMQNLGLYGSMIRGNGNLLIENSYYESVFDPFVAFVRAEGEEPRLSLSGNICDRCEGRMDDTGGAADPGDYYSYTLDKAEDVPALVSKFAGPRQGGGPTPDELVVSLDGSGDFASIGGALGSVPPDSRKPVTITIEPGFYREIVQVWPTQRNVILQGATGDPDDVVISYDLGIDQERFYGGTYGHVGSPTMSIYADDVTVRDLTVENVHEDGAAIAVRTTGERTVFENTRFVSPEGASFAGSDGWNPIN